jgi:hypothetical protein
MQGGRIKVCVAWHGFLIGETAEELWSSCSNDGGRTWPSAENASHTSGSNEYSINPSVAFDGIGRLHVAWEEHDGSTLNNPIVQVYHGMRWLDVFLPIVRKK